MHKAGSGMVFARGLGSGVGSCCLVDYSILAMKINKF